MTLYLYMQITHHRVEQALADTVQNDQIRRAVTATKQTRTDVEHMCGFYAKLIRKSLTASQYYEWQRAIANNSDAVFNLQRAHRWQDPSPIDLELLRSLITETWQAAGQANAITEAQTARCQQHIEKYLQLSALEEALAEDRMNVLRDLIEAALGLRNRAQEQETTEGAGEGE
jgi:hypothetical protein